MKNDSPKTSAHEGLTIESTADCIFVRITGTYSLQLEKQYATKIAEACRKHNCSKVLIDMRTQAGEISIIDRFELGTHISEIWPARTVLAIVDSPQRVLPDHFFEKVIVNRGVPSKEFTDLQEAKEWLSSRAG